MGILNLEAYNVGGDISAYFELPKAPPYEEIAEKLELLGIESLNFIENDGNVITICLVYVAALLWVTVSILCCHNVWCCKKVSQFLERKLFFNALIILLKESLLVTTICLLVGNANHST
jgi:hypothetical protein